MARSRACIHPIRASRDDETLSVSNPGGFVEGVTLRNLLVVEPRPRNPALADVFKRLGLVERTGRGVDLIFQYVLRYGRPAPSYERSNPTTVAVDISCQDADLDFLTMVVEQEQRTGNPLPLDSLLVLSALRGLRRVNVQEIVGVLQKSQTVARSVLERLHESGLVQAHGTTKGRYYTLSAGVYRRMGPAGGYERQAPLTTGEIDARVDAIVARQGRIRRRDLVQECRLSSTQASRYLGARVKQGRLVAKGSGKSTYYEVP